MREILGSGAEAIIERTGEGIEKTRQKKSYRHPELDLRLRTMRTKAEAKILAKARMAGVPTPMATIINESTLRMNEIPGCQVRDVLNQKPELGIQIGEHLAKLHDADINHADLTTSNMMYDQETGNITIIDFGLSFHSARIEDKAVDLHLFRQSLMSKHHSVVTTVWKHFLRGYRTSTHSEAVLDRLKKVEARGRNKGGS